MRKFFVAALITFSLFLSSKVYASHGLGADFNYEQIGQDSFRITLNLFRDCSGVSVDLNDQVYTFLSNCYSFKDTLTYDTSFEISQVCPSALANTTCSNGYLPGVEQYVFSSIIHLPSCSNGYLAYWNLSDRNSTVNISSSYIQMCMDAEIHNELFSHNNSPKFTNNEIPYICVNQPYTYPLDVIDPDGDSLVLSIDTPYSNFSQGLVSVAYNSGYSANNPIGVPFTIDNQNKSISFTPIQPGFFTLKVKIEEYRNGTYIGYYTKEFEYLAQNCNNSQPYVLYNGITNFQGTGNQIDSNSISVCNGDSISFDIYFADTLLNSQLTGDSVFLYSIIDSLLPNSLVNIINGDTAKIHIEWLVPSSALPFYSISIFANDNACNYQATNNFTFDIRHIQNTTVGEDAFLCRGVDTALISAIGGNIFEWSVITNPDGSFGDPMILSGAGQNFKDTTGTNGQNIWISPQHTTTYQIISDLNYSCKNIDTITVWVARDFNINTLGDTTVCPNDSLFNFQIEVITDSSSSTGGAPFNFSYYWNNSNTLSNNTISNPTAIINSTTNYVISVSSDSGCTKIDTVELSFTPTFPTESYLNFQDSIICNGDSTVGNITLNSTEFNHCGLSSYSCDSTTYVSTLSGNSFIHHVGYSSPFLEVTSRRLQIIYTASELQSFGLNQGKITSISFYVDSLVSQSSFQNYTIQIGCTSLPDGSIMWDTGLTTVYGPTNFNLTNSGWITFEFNSPYVWDGINNLILEFCYNATSIGYNTYLEYTNTSFYAGRFYHTISNNNNICNYPNYLALFSMRPVTRFGYCNNVDPSNYIVNWGSNNSVSDSTASSPYLYPNSNTTYSVTITDTLDKCSRTISNTLNVINGNFQYSDSLCKDAIDTLIPSNVGGYFYGTGIIDSTLGIFNASLADSGYNTIYYTINSPNITCTSIDSNQIFVDLIPDVSISDSVFCITTGLQTLQTNTQFGIWYGQGVIDSIAGVFDPSILSSLNTEVYYQFNGVYCSSIDTFSINLYEPHPFLTIDKNLCSNDTSFYLDSSIITSFNSSWPYNPLFSWSGIGVTGNTFDVSGLTSGSYIVTVTSHDSAGNCTYNDSIIVVLYDTTAISTSLAFDYCINENQPIYLNQFTPNLDSYITSPLVSGGVNLTSPFVPSNVGAGSWSFYGTYTNINGCTSYVIDTISVSQTPDASFSYTNNGLLVNFNSNAVIGDQANWTFGDGNSSNQFYPQHTYLNGGMYIVELAVTNGCGTDNSLDTIYVYPVGVDDVDNKNWIQIFPNPSKDVLNIKNISNSKLNGELLIYSLSGSTVYQEKINTQPNEVISINHQLAAGTYMLKLNSISGIEFTAKLIITQ